MRQFDISKAKTPQKQAFREMHKLLAGKFDFRGPFGTKHGWPYFVIDTPSQSISIRSTKPKGGNRMFIVYENFGEMLDNQVTHHCNRDTLGDTIDEILMRDIDNWPPNWL